MQFMDCPLVRRKEVLVYPITSLVAEFGGTFGLFVGFSFVMFWDMTDTVLGFLVNFEIQSCISHYQHLRVLS